MSCFCFSLTFHYSTAPCVFLLPWLIVTELLCWTRCVPLLWLCTVALRVVHGSCVSGLGLFDADGLYCGCTVVRLLISWWMFGLFPIEGVRG